MAAAKDPEIAPAAMPVGAPAEAQPLPSLERTNGTGGLKERSGLSVTPPAGAIPADMAVPSAAPVGLEPDPDRTADGSLDRQSEGEGPEHLHPPIPDDPGVTEEERLEKDSRRFKVF